MKTKCFIASAFGHSDVDVIYEKAIVPILRKLNIVPQRVDRINHNEKIDSKILELIQNCDFGIVDITYARPSVYFEAGYLEGLKKNVIYIARHDHFEPHPENADYKIHFDLITQNIISWAGPTGTFNDKLKARINLINKSLVSKKEQDIIEIKSIELFNKLSVYLRMQIIRERLINFVKQLNLNQLKEGYFFQVYGNDKIRVHIDVFATMTPFEIRTKIQTFDTISVNFTLNTYLVIGILERITKKKIESALPLFQQVDENTYQFQSLKIVFLHSIDSEYKVETLLSQLKIK